MEIVLYVVASLVMIILLLALIAPTRVSYTERISINAPLHQIYDDIRLQEHLMRWSAWPKETNSTCAVEGTDGQVGTRIAFFTKGKRVGHQEIVGFQENTEISLTLVGPGPPHRPSLTFEMKTLDEKQTEVLANFIKELPRPFNIIWKFAGLSKWTRKMHKLDLKGLKAFAEPPHIDSSGTEVGYPPTGLNPYQHTEFEDASRTAVK